MKEETDYHQIIGLYLIINRWNNLVCFHYHLLKMCDLNVIFTRSPVEYKHDEFHVNINKLYLI